MGKYIDDSKALLEYVGGKENISAVTHCVTRMRFVLKDTSKADKEKIEALNQAESTIYQTEKTLNELGDKVSAEDKSAIESALENLKSVKDKESSTAEELKTAMDEVMNKFHKISEQMYQQAQAAQGAESAQDAGYDQGANAGNGDDNVVDADFTEVDDK